MYMHLMRPLEFPICLMTWTDKQPDGTASKLEIVDEFTTFVKPTWRPKLSSFCTELTGITQVLEHTPGGHRDLLIFSHRNKLIRLLSSSKC